MERQKSILVSVIMLNYKTPVEYLHDAIESILNQTLQDFELIIVDDGSLDESTKYIKSVKDPRIIVIENDRNMGQAKSRNRGLEAAKGDYIAVLDSDDVALPTRLEKQVEYMKKNPGIIVCGTWFERFGLESIIRKPLIDDFELYRCQLLFSNTPICICHSSAMFSAELLRANKIHYDESLPKAQDYGMWVVCSRVGGISILDEVLVRYRVHQKQISTAQSEEQMKCANLVSRRQLEELGITENQNENRWRRGRVDNADDLIHYCAWLEEINSANRIKGYLHESSLTLYIKTRLKFSIRHLKKNEVIRCFFLGNSLIRKCILGLVSNKIHNLFLNPGTGT